MVGEVWYRRCGGRLYLHVDSAESDTLGCDDGISPEQKLPEPVAEMTTLDHVTPRMTSTIRNLGLEHPYYIHHASRVLAGWKGMGSKVHM